MNNDDVFDKVGICGDYNKKGWNRLPTVLKYFISSTQKNLFDRIKRKVESIYGQDGVSSLVKTSGWRSFSTNTYVGGVSDSLHLFGCAIDFRKTGIFKDRPIPVCCELECIDSGKCWHIQFKRC